MVTGPDLLSRYEVSVSMEMDQLSSNLLLFMHGQGGEGQERIEDREGGYVTDISSIQICISKCSPQDVQQIKPEQV